MNTIIILGNIITILLIGKLESTRISPSERLHELETINTVKNKVIEEYLPNYDPREAFEFLSQYTIRNEVEMYGFAEHLNKTGNPPEWSKTRKLKNYQSYNFLRYHFPLEAYELDEHQAEMRVNYLRRRFFPNAPILNSQLLIKSYYERKVDDLMLFEDYYAIMILMKSVSVLDVDDPANWRIRRALYTLAIRNYNPNSILNYDSKSCYFKMMKTSSFVESIKFGDIFETATFIICSSKYKESYSYNNEKFYFNFTLFSVNHEMVITDSLLAVSLKDIVEFDDEEIYVILPKVHFKLLSNLGFIINNGKTNFYVKMSTFPIDDSANWLTKLANEVEKYKEMEKEYFNTHPESHK
ncbi:uncharacterized protein LOC122510253 [Leptopilina heterotoma]|uniref:uncharacterized protein LOC122510253 n=1 Tax=Leptopilina heterotoma TaxID=63436 RepID=UPI001CA9D3A9|nr:uncharacterized protein LOC122510253 [Leptopilina heterotoma]